MPYEKQIWRDETRTQRLKLSQPDANGYQTVESVDFVGPGQAGDDVGAARLGHMEMGIEDAHAQLTAHKAENAPHGLEPTGWIDNATTTLVDNAEGNLIRVDESVSGVLRRRTTLGYVSGSLKTVNVKVYASNGSTIEREWTDTLAMPNITRVVIK